jgi:hypothetical protein
MIFNLRSKQPVHATTREGDELELAGAGTDGAKARSRAISTEIAMDFDRSERGGIRWRPSLPECESGRGIARVSRSTVLAAPYIPVSVRD